MDYAQIANDARKKVLNMIYEAQTSHIGSNFSVIDILTVLFEKVDLTKDIVILSAGWKAAAFYYFLARKGIIGESELDTYCKEGSRLIGLTEPSVPGVFFAGGSMGMGLPAGVGAALAKKIKGEEGTVYVIMSDGELQCGTTWESALIAAQHKLDNLLVLVDNNRLQAMGNTSEVLGIENLEEKFLSFRWGFARPHGHEYKSIEEAITQDRKKDFPSILCFHTTKGKGVSFMENSNLYHYKAPSKEEYELAMKELNG